ncbi:MAG: phenylalanine--tRNA ligase subunit alpha, partial [Firmicutes bacterium]|nr:phenylalanine--tRNA ligase subunit alpha [Bacillota bacterium]
MKEKLEILLQEGKERILAAKTEVELQEIKASLLGKKGSVTEMMKEL